MFNRRVGEGDSAGFGIEIERVVGNQAVLRIRGGNVSVNVLGNGGNGIQTFRACRHGSRTDLNGRRFRAAGDFVGGSVFKLNRRSRANRCYNNDNVGRSRLGGFAVNERVSSQIVQTVCNGIRNSRFAVIVLIRLEVNRIGRIEGNDAVKGWQSVSVSADQSSVFNGGFVNIDNQIFIRGFAVGNRIGEVQLNHVVARLGFIRLSVDCISRRRGVNRSDENRNSRSRRFSWIVIVDNRVRECNRSAVILRLSVFNLAVDNGNRAGGLVAQSGNFGQRKRLAFLFPNRSVVRQNVNRANGVLSLFVVSRLVILSVHRKGNRSSSVSRQFAQRRIVVDGIRQRERLFIQNRQVNAVRSVKSKRLGFWIVRRPQINVADCNSSCRSFEVNSGFAQRQSGNRPSVVVDVGNDVIEVEGRSSGQRAD